MTGAAVAAIGHRVRDMSQDRLIRLRYPAVCSVCGEELPARSEARWDRAAKKATCTVCLEGDRPSASVEAPATERDSGEIGTFERGEPGAAAARRFERLHERREKRVRERYGRLGGIYLALTDDPQSTKAWDAGSRGERALGRYLETLHDGESIVVLHDRRIPGTRANIDHIAVSASGIYAIDAKNYAGKVRRVDRGGLFSTDWRLYVGRRECTKLVVGMAKQVAAIREALGPSLIGGPDLAVHSALRFVAAEWSLFARPFEIREVWVGWANALGERLKEPGPLEREQVRAVAERVAAALPPA